MSCQLGILLRKFFESGKFGIEHAVFQHIIQLRIPGFGGVCDDALFEPCRQAVGNGVLHHFLNIATEQHRVEVYGGNSFTDLSSQVLVVAVKVHENPESVDPSV